MWISSSDTPSALPSLFLVFDTTSEIAI